MCLGTLRCHLSRPEGHKVPQIQIQTLVMKPDEDVRVTENDFIQRIRCVFGQRRYEQWKCIFNAGT